MKEALQNFTKVPRSNPLCLFSYSKYYDRLGSDLFLGNSSEMLKCTLLGTFSILAIEKCHGETATCSQEQLQLCPSFHVELTAQEEQQCV